MNLYMTVYVIGLGIEVVQVRNRPAVLKCSLSREVETSFSVDYKGCLTHGIKNYFQTVYE